MTSPTCLGRRSTVSQFFSQPVEDRGIPQRQIVALAVLRAAFLGRENQSAMTSSIKG
jgi:hypothetical protein